MNEQENAYGMLSGRMPVAQAGAAERADFIRKTYLHLGGAVGIYVGLIAAILSTPNVQWLVEKMAAAWILVFVLFMFVSWAAERMARSAVSLSMQYAGLALYVLAMAVISTPLIWIATKFGSPNTLP